MDEGEFEFVCLLEFFDDGGEFDEVGSDACDARDAHAVRQLRSTGLGKSLIDLTPTHSAVSLE